MAKRAIGIDLSSESMRIVQVAQKGDRFLVEQAFIAPMRRDTDSTVDIIRKLPADLRFDWRAETAIAMPAPAVFFRDFHFSQSELAALDRQVTHQVDNAFPIAPTDIIAQVCSEEEGSQEERFLLVAATSKSALKKRLEQIADFNVTPKLVEADILAIRATVLANHPEFAFGRSLLIFLDHNHLSLAVLCDSRVLVIRNTPLRLAETESNDGWEAQIAELIEAETRITWQKLFGCLPNQTNQAILALGHPYSQRLLGHIKGKLSCPVTPADPTRHVLANGADPLDGQMILAMGLALRVLEPQQTSGINFLAGQQGAVLPAANVKRELSICAVLGLGILLVLAAGLFVDLAAMERVYADILEHTNRTFRETLPQERRIVNPLAQLDQAIAALPMDRKLGPGDRSGRLHPLAVLQELGKTQIDGASIILTKLNMVPDAVTISATSPSSQALDQWRRQLEGLSQFSMPQVETHKINTNTGQVDFVVRLPFKE